MLFSIQDMSCRCGKFVNSAKSMEFIDSCLLLVYGNVFINCSILFTNEHTRISNYGTAEKRRGDGRTVYCRPILFTLIQYYVRAQKPLGNFRIPPLRSALNRFLFLFTRWYSLYRLRGIYTGGSSSSKIEVFIANR